MTTTTKHSPISVLPFRNVNTRNLRTGDLFMTQDGNGILVLARINYGYGQFSPIESITAVDLQLHTVQMPHPMLTAYLVYDDDTLPTCETCENGCHCDPLRNDIGCEHAYCWAAVKDASCPGADAEHIATARSIATRLARR
jgi:hypothetical protein